MILSLRTFLLCVAAGVALGGSMIITGIGPGLSRSTSLSTPRHRDETRKTDLNLLVEALSRYQEEHGKLPETLPSSDTPICTTSGQSCRSVRFTDLSFLISGGSYLEAIPTDPGQRSLWESGYTISQLPDGSIRLTAPKAELTSITAIAPGLPPAASPSLQPQPSGQSPAPQR